MTIYTLEKFTEARTPTTLASAQDWKDDSRRRKMSLKPEERVQGLRPLSRPFRGVGSLEDICLWLESFKAPAVILIQPFSFIAVKPYWSPSAVAENAREL